MKPDDYFYNDAFEVVRFGTDTIMINHCTPAQQMAHEEYLLKEYPIQYETISQKVFALREKVVQCDPYNLLMYLRSVTMLTQLNSFSESEYENKANAAVRAQEYIQSLIASTEVKCSSIPETEQEALYGQILDDFNELYKDLLFFYFYWAAYTQKAKGISDARLSSIVEAQYMYWVRGKRYQIFELEPLKKLLPPHDAVLQELFCMSSDDIISGLEKLRYSLSQGYIDTMADLFNEYEKFRRTAGDDKFLEKTCPNRGEHIKALIGKALGDDLINVKKVTGWDSRFIDTLSFEIGECQSFWDDSEFSGWPIVELPVMRKPFIKINGTAYAFLYYALFDNIYRNIQKSIIQRKPEYQNEWKERQTSASEGMVANLFLKMLPSAEIHIGNYYPVKTSLKQMNENDIIVIYQNFLFIIEVKAGSFPSTPPITDFDAYINAYHNLAEMADSQCSRTLTYISNHAPAQFYNHEKKPTFQLSNPDSYENIFTLSVTVDNFNEFAAKAEKLSEISLKEKTIVISYDDLLNYSGYFDSPIYFLHYLTQRKAAIDVPQYRMTDELDHLGLYISRNLYSLNPSQLTDTGNIFPFGFRCDLDKYFAMLFVNPAKARKPVQDIPKEISEIIEFLEHDISPEKIRLACYFLNLSADAKSGFAEQIKYVLKRQKEIGRGLPVIALGDNKYCAFITIPRIKQYSVSEQLDYAYAVASRNEAIPVMWISLEYNEENVLISVQGQKCSFSDLEGNKIDQIKSLGCKIAKNRIDQFRKLHKKIGRNDYCPCGSGKKYKFCCLKNE